MLRGFVIVKEVGFVGKMGRVVWVDEKFWIFSFLLYLRWEGFNPSTLSLLVRSDLDRPVCYSCSIGFLSRSMGSSSLNSWP